MNDHTTRAKTLTNPTSTETQLRNLLQTIYDNNHVVAIDTLLSQIQSATLDDIEYLIFIREHGWFKDSVLNFNYLAFYYQNRSCKRFKTGHDLDTQIQTCIESDFIKTESRLCVIYHRKNAKCTKAVITLLMRILVAFYINCGSKDFFLESVASRLTKEFFEKPHHTHPNSLTAFISDKLHIDAKLFVPKIPFLESNSEYTITEMLCPFPSLTQSEPDIADDMRIKSAIKTSYRRKTLVGANDITGRTCVIKTFFSHRITSSSIESTPPPLSQRCQAIAIFTSKDAHGTITLDAVRLASTLISKYLDAKEETERTSLIVTFHSATCLAENSLPTDGESTVAGIWHKWKSALATPLKPLSRITNTTEIIIWITNPLKTAIEPIIYIGRDGHSGPDDRKILPISPHDPDHIVANSLKCKTPLFRTRPSHLRTVEQLHDIPAHVRESHLRKLEAEIPYITSRKELTFAAVAAPLYRDGLLIGAIEFLSDEVLTFQGDIEVIQDFAILSGEMLRRIELANDRIHFSKMSLVLGNFHRQQKTARRIKNDKEQTNEAPEPIENDIGVAVSTKWYDLVEKFDEKTTVAESIIKIYKEMQNNTAHGPISDKIESTYHPSDISGQAYYELLYKPETMVDASIVPSLGVAPITKRDGKHYGLFLLCAQIRMIGGWTRFLQTPEIDSAHFVLQAYIPYRSTADHV
jgi:hypothetical protein